MNIDKNRKIRDSHRTFVYKTVGNVEKILTEHAEDLTLLREKLTALKSLLTEKLETTKKLDETTIERVSQGGLCSLPKLPYVPMFPYVFLNFSPFNKFASNVSVL